MAAFPIPAKTSASDWLARCRERIAERDGSLSGRDLAELSEALWQRPSCRALAPERAADLLFEGRLNSIRGEDF